MYRPRAKQPGKLEPFQPYLEERMRLAVERTSAVARTARARLLGQLHASKKNRGRSESTLQRSGN